MDKRNDADMARVGRRNDADMARVTVRLPRKMLEELRQMAAEDKRSMNADVVWLIAAAIRGYLGPEEE